MTAGWVEDLAAGPAASFGSLFGEEFAKGIIENLDIISFSGGQLLDAKLQNMFGNIASVDDLKPSSSFLNALNTTPNSTLPSARYAIFGAEDGFEYVRLAESFIRKDSGNPLEQGTSIRYHHAAASFYFVATAYYTYLSAKYFYKYSHSDSSDPYYFSYYDRAVYFAQIAREWFRGFASLVYYQQRDWDQQVIGVNYYYQNGEVFKDANDGLLPYATQAPSFFNTSDNIDRILPADGANHVEETVHPSVKDRLEEVFRNSDVNIPEAGVEEPFSVSINGVPYVNDGQSATFSADVTGAEGSVDYQWYYRQETYSSWIADGSNSPTYEHTFYSAPGGETAHSAVKLVVSSAGETASDVHSVEVYGCGSSGIQSESMETNIIIPCD